MVPNSCCVQYDGTAESALKQSKVSAGRGGARLDLLHRNASTLPNVIYGNRASVMYPAALH